VGADVSEHALRSSKEERMARVGRTPGRRARGGVGWPASPRWLTDQSAGGGYWLISNRTEVTDQLV